MIHFSPADFLSKWFIPWSSAPSCDVFYVTDNARWSFYWDAHYITQGVCRQGIETDISHKPWGHRGKVIHFGDRYGFLDMPIADCARIARQNTIILTWFHGERSDPEMSPWFDRLLEREGFIEKIVTTCTSSRYHLTSVGIDSERIMIIPLGVDTDRFRPCGVDRKLAIRRELGIPKEAFCIGSFQKDGQGWNDGAEPKLIKGPDVFLETVSQLARRQENLFVLLTGPARGYVKQGLDRIGIPYLHRNLEQYWDLVPFYQALDSYLIASRCEGGPKALLESWAAGIPLVSTRVGMPADLIQDGINGGLADSEDSEALADLLDEVCHNSEFRNQCRHQGLECVRSYTWEKVAEQYAESLYRPQLQRSRAA